MEGKRRNSVESVDSVCPVDSADSVDSVDSVGRKEEEDSKDLDWEGNWEGEVTGFELGKVEVDSDWVVSSRSTETHFQGSWTCLLYRKSTEGK